MTGQLPNIQTLDVVVRWLEKKLTILESVVSQIEDVERVQALWDKRRELESVLEMLEDDMDRVVSGFLNKWYGLEVSVSVRDEDDSVSI